MEAASTCGRHVRARPVGVVHDARFELPPIVVRTAYRACNANPHGGAPDEPSLSTGRNPCASRPSRVTSRAVSDAPH